VVYDLSNGSVFSDLESTRFQGDGVIFKPIDARNVLCAQFTHDLFAIAKFLLCLRQARLAGGGPMFSTCPFVRLLPNCVHGISETDTPILIFKKTWANNYIHGTRT